MQGLDGFFLEGRPVRMFASLIADNLVQNFHRFY